MLEQLGRCAQLCGELAEARRAWEEAIDGLNGDSDGLRQAQIRRGLASVYAIQGDGHRAVAARTDAAEVFEAAGLDADAATEWLLAADEADDFATTDRLLVRAVDAARRAGRTDLESRCLSFQGIRAGRAGRRDDGLTLVRAALALALAGDHVQEAVHAYWALGVSSNDWGDYPSAESALHEALAFCQASELDEQEHFCTSCLIVVLGNAGEWERAEALSRDLLDQPSLAPHSRAHAVLTLGLIDAARGLTKQARPLLNQAHAIACDARMHESARASELGLALVSELEGSRLEQWHALVARPVDEVSASRAKGLRLAATFAARRGDMSLLNACAAATADYAALFGSADALAALAHVLGEVALAEARSDRRCRAVRDRPRPPGRGRGALRACADAGARRSRTDGSGRARARCGTTRERPSHVHQARRATLRHPGGRRSGRRGRADRPAARPPSCLCRASGAA